MISRALISLILLLLILPALVQAQEKDVQQLVVPLESAGFVAFKTEAVKPEKQNASGSSEIDLQSAVKPQVLVDENHVVHRVLVDSSGALIFGYDLVIEPLVNSRQFRVFVRPLDASFEKRMRERQSTQAGRTSLQMNVSTLPRPTEAQIIDDGDGFALELLVNPQTGVKIVDVVKASFDQSRLWESPKGPPARDFTLDSVEMAVKDYKLYLNGRRVGGGRPSQGFTGALLWFYVPDKGRFIFSLTPREGYEFEKVAQIEDNKISFTIGEDVYEWVSSAPIVGSGGKWNLWVLRDRRYSPSVFYVPKDSKDNSFETTGVVFPPTQEVRVMSLDTSANSSIRTQTGEILATPAKAKGEKIPLPRARIEVGSADRIENLWPR
ncbi:MAG TPA: hypothetical protein VJS44_20330 [Pyrinomonadaceae bacterium]|nr:hypothetical protein [Pyrinomonadaceae bacterium]